MAQEWNDINDPGFFRKKNEEPPKPIVTLDKEPDDQNIPGEPEVEIVEAKQWDPGPDGFEFNKECFLTVKAVFLKATSKKQLLADAFVVYNNEEEDLHQAVETFLDDSGSAQFKVKLYYGNSYYEALRENPDAQCNYLLKNIRHLQGKKPVNSELLVMPQGQGSIKQVPAAAPAQPILPTSATFSEHAKTIYGFDDFTNHSQPWKSLEKDKKDMIVATSASSGAGANTHYKCTPAGIADVSPEKGTKDAQDLTLKGGAKGTTALKVTDGTNDVATMDIKVYDPIKKTVAIRLVHEKNYKSTDVSDAKITEFLKKVYRQAVCSFKCTRLPAKTIEFDDDKDGKVDVNSWMSKEMRLIRDACKDDKYDINIFLVNNPTDNSTGFMDYNQRYGFIHADKSLRGEQTIAHEIGHGAFSLAHTPADSDNVMYNYTSTTAWRLRKDQWDKINPS